MIGQVDGSRRQGRPRLRWMDSIKENTGFDLEKLKRDKDRNKWCSLVEEKTIETGNEQILKDRRGREWQTTSGHKICLGNPDTGSPGVYLYSKDLLILLQVFLGIFQQIAPALNRCIYRLLARPTEQEKHILQFNPVAHTAAREAV
jgi:hypothetical protein